MTPNPFPLPHASYQRFESAREYEAMFDDLIPTSQQAIRIFDRTLSAAFNSPARCERLGQFLRAGGLNRLHIVVHETRGADRACPRLLALLRRFSHVARVRQTPRAARHVYDRFVVFDAVHYLHCFHHDHARFGRGLNDIEGAQQLLERFDELWEVSQPALGASVLGL
jgi:hypothetical protein